jgi:hypothetical protein
MIFINPSSHKIIIAKRRFFVEMQEFIFKRIDKLRYCERITSLSSSNKKAITNFFGDFINSNIEKILIGLPYELETINSQINIFLSPKSELFKAIEYVFNYDLFIKKTTKRYNAYDLANDLEIETCTYCNRNYAKTVITKNKEKIIRPQFDHFCDKDSNPLMALSFYNLIPSCSICNSNIKHGKKFELSSHIHPYVDNIINDFRFTYDYTIESKNGLKVIIDKPLGSKIEKTFGDMSLEIVYNAHTDQLKELLDIKYKFSDKYLSILSTNILDSYKLSQKELYRLAFGTELEETDFNKRPFSKFKNDILKELDIL